MLVTTLFSVFTGVRVNYEERRDIICKNKKKRKKENKSGISLRLFICSQFVVKGQSIHHQIRFPADLCDLHIAIIVCVLLTSVKNYLSR